MNLSRLSYVILALVCLLGIGEQWFSLSSDWKLWRVAFALWIFGLCYEWIKSRQIALKVELDEHSRILALGRLSPLKLLLSTDSPRPISIECAPNLPSALTPEKTTFTSEFSHSQEVSIDATAQILGEHLWQTVHLRILGSMGLAHWPQKHQLDTPITIMPDLLGPNGKTRGDIDNSGHSLKVGQGFEFHFLREYTPGDPLKSVDWKATARVGKPITRIFQQEQYAEILLILDIGRTSRTYFNNLSQFAHYANLATTFAQYATSNGDKVGIVAVSDTLQAIVPPAAGLATVRQIRQTLTNLEPMPVETDLVSAALYAQNMLRKRTLVILLTDLYGQALEGSFGDSIKLWRQRHLPVVVGLIGQELMDQATRSAQTAEDTYESLAAREYVRALNTNARAATRLGARSIITRPETLQSRIMSEYRMLKSQNRI